MWAWTLRFLLLAAAAANTFNFEVSAHVTDVVKMLLEQGTVPVNFSEQIFQDGLFDVRNSNMTSSLFYFTIKTISASLNVYMALEDGSYSCVTENFHTYDCVFATLYNFTGRYLCSQRNPGPNSTRDHYECDSLGRPSTYLTSIPYDPRQRPWYVQTKAKGGQLWVGPYIDETVSQPIISYCLPLYDSCGVFEGVVALDFPLDLISAFLATEYNGTGRGVYVIDHTGLLVGTSVAGLSLLAPDGVTMKTANNSGYDQLTRIMQTNPFQQENTVYIVEQLYVQATRFVDPNTSVDWWIIVTMPAEPQKDYLLLTDAGAGGTIAVSVVAWFVSLVAGAMFLYWYNTKIIKMAQRRLVGLFLLGCIMLNCTFFSILLPNTVSACRFGGWWPNIWFTVTFAPILVKTWFMWAVFNKTRDVQHILGNPVPWTLGWVKSGLMGLTTRTFIPILIETLLLVAATANGEMDPYENVVVGSDGVYQTHILCGPNGAAVFTTLDIVYKGILVLIGCVLAFLTRHINSFLAESYSLAIVVYSISIFGLMIYMIVNIATLGVEAQVLLSVVGVCCSTTVAIIVLLGPRFLKLLTVGDEAAAAWINNAAISSKHTTPTLTSKSESKGEQSTVTSATSATSATEV